MNGDILVKEIMEIRSDMPMISCNGFREKIDEERKRKSAFVKMLKNLSPDLIWPSIFERC